MFDPKDFESSVFSCSKSDFESMALSLFQYQWESNRVYNAYASHLKRHPSNVRSLKEIPFLPIDFFKNHQVVSGNWQPEKIYLSSGTTTSLRSQHLIKSESFYHNLAKKTFEQQFGPLRNYRLLALLPSYQEQGNSSLISMIDYFMRFTREGSGYFLNNYQSLIDELKEKRSEPTLLFGVTYALLALCEKTQLKLSNTLVFETGGMKGRGKEITRQELHRRIQKKMQPASIHSEYGMTELSSQAYSRDLSFTFPNWAKVTIRDVNDPFEYVPNGKTGGVNIIDLGNVHTCAFIETKDLGRCDDRGIFEILGRFDNSDLRGCNHLE